MADNLELAVAHAMNDYRLARARMGLLNPGMGLDSKRQGTAWCEYGWKEELGFSDFYNLYRRGGLAHGVVEKIVTTCWRTAPWVIEGDDQDNSRKETAWERTNKPLFNGGRLWRAVAEADRRRLVGRYSGLLLHVNDGALWNQPVKTKGKSLVKATPAWACNLEPSTHNTNERDPSYGAVTMWKYTEAGFNGAVGRQVEVHPDRIFILGDWSADAIGFLEPAFTAFVSLEKIEGGSGESFLKNAARQLSVSFDKEVDLRGIASMYGVSIEKLHEKFNDAARDVNRANDLLLITQGATTTPLVTAVADPEPSYNVNLQTAAAALDIPTKILVGMQTGERASTEDQKYFNARCQARRGDLSFEIHDLMAHLTRIGIVATVAEFTVMWDDLTESALADRLASAKTMAEINSASLAMGEPVFSADEMREVAGYDALSGSDPLPDVEDEDGDEGEDAYPAQQSS